MLCDNCDVEYSSSIGASACSLAAHSYYLTYGNDDDIISHDCPKNTKCEGSDYAPVPNSGYWVDRSSYAHVSDIYECPRETCKGAKSNSSCWKYAAYNQSNPIHTSCNAAKLLCTEGAYGPLCGSCEVGYVYHGESKTCTQCEIAKDFAYTFIGIGCGIIFLFILLNLAHEKKIINFSSKHFRSFDSGSSKVNLFVAS